MKKITHIILVLTVFTGFAGETQKEYRSLIASSVGSESSAKQLYKTTRSINQQSGPLMYGYKAMSELMMCNHALNPIAKLNYFNLGKSMLESAIKADPTNIELRYFRFSTQCNVPSLLNYSSNKNEDKKLLLLYIRNSENKLKDDDLYNRIKQFLLNSKECTATEKKEIQTL